jgi:hypothetical protein
MALLHHLPLADVDEIIKVAFTIIIMVMWGLSQLIGSRPKDKPPARPRQAPPERPGMAPGQADKPPTLEETLRREVEEFMRRAQARPAESAKRSPPRPQPAAGARREARPVRGAADRPAGPRRLVEAPRPLSQQQPRSGERKPPTGAGVGEHVAQHVRRSTEALATHAQTLGADVALADERMQMHLQEKFTHQVGALEHRADGSQKRAVRSAVAQGLFDMMSKPEGMRQLIVAGEILRRPEERWG